MKTNTAKPLKSPPTSIASVQSKEISRESDNILQTVKTIMQDFVAPDVRELKVRMASMENQNKVYYEALRTQLDTQFKAIIAAISQSKAESDLSAFRQIAALSERVAALEAHRQ